MKRAMFLIISSALVLSCCKGQTKREEKTVTTTVREKKAGKPDVNITVNKHYDKKGNLIAFDSTYSSYYSTRKGDKVLMDSLFKVFKSPFVEQFPLMNDKYFKDLFFTDSLLVNDFFHEDFFRKRLEMNEIYMKRMMQHMDSVKNEFFKTQSIKIKKKL